VCRGRDHHGLGNGAVRSVRRRELGPDTWSGRMVVLCCGRDGFRFSVGAVKMVCAVASPVGQCPGRGLRHAGCTMPCLGIGGVVQTITWAHGNARAGRGVLGRRRARAGRGHSATYGGSGRQGSIGRAWRC
jgi:hypothetical protein